MTQDTPHTTAVLMGDLVKSERHPAKDALHRLFNAAIDQANRDHAGDILSPLTITLGDEFQGVTRTLEQAAAIARGVRFHLLQHDVQCRFVIAQARLDSPLNPDKAWNMMGTGLGRARDKLNEKRAGQTYRFSLPDAPVTEVLLDAVGTGLSVIERGWTTTQREVIWNSLCGQSVKDIAAARDVTIHNIYKIRASGDYDAYKVQWAAIDTALTATSREDTE